jgi:PhnB protein
VRAEPYLYFGGRCEEALGFYRAAIGAEAAVIARFGDADSPVAHAVIRVGNSVILASDGPGGGPAEFGGFSLSLTASDDAEAEKVFAALADAGQVQVPIAPTPFASRLGILTDRFGVPWTVVAEGTAG